MSLVLIVDDHRDTGRLLARFLRANKVEAVAVESGVAALAYVRAAPTRPDLVLMDISMPEMDGLETLRRMRQLPGGAELPVVMLTAISDQGSRTRAEQLGARDYLVKGTFEPKQLVAAIARYATPKPQ
jgi:CheY-like chemotaxis protein